MNITSRQLGVMGVSIRNYNSRFLHKSVRKNISALKAQLKKGFIARIRFQVEVWQNHYWAKLFFYNHFAVQSFCQKKRVWECECSICTSW